MDPIHCFSCRRFLNSELPKGGQKADQGDIVGIWVAFIIIFVLVLFVIISICKCSIRLHNSSQNTCSRQPNAQIQQELVDLPVFIFGAKSSPSTSTLPSSSSPPPFALSDESCSICLDEYADGQSIRVLPGCKHMFHKDCIDQWLSSHSSSSCPICRERILENNVKPTGIDVADVNSVPLPIFPFGSGRTLNSL